jgi:hypothetical protein
MDETVQVRVLYSEGCPNAPLTIELIEKVGKEIEVRVAIEEVLVESQDQAAALRRLGSPTVQINGVDIAPSARGKTNFTIA